jgi:hypothetical protein
MLEAVPMRSKGLSNLGFTAWMMVLALSGVLSAAIDGTIGWESALQSIRAWVIQFGNADR